MAPVIIIPAYQPSEQLVLLVEQLLQQAPMIKIIVVDDGSSLETQSIFDKIGMHANLEVLHHAINLGKGQALKTAFNHFLIHYKDHIGVVTADADGQHSPQDILRVASCLQKTPDTLWLGSRKLDESVPLRSRFGNDLTRRIFKLVMGHHVHDTQTGLRGIPAHILPHIVKISAAGYDFELDMLVKMIRKKITIKEVSIETIYIEGNKSSHFNPVIDSLKIYFVFLRYIMISLACAGLDFVLFFISHFITQKIFLSAVVARVLSGIVNFTLVKTVTFKSEGQAATQALKYIALAGFSLFLSYCLIIALIKFTAVNVYFSKIIADVIVFLLNFVVQRVLIFSQGTEPVQVHQE